MKNKVVIIAIAAFLMLLMACNPETPVQYHKVNYIGADGNVMETHDVENGKADIPPQENPKNVGHEFIGWSLSKDGKSIYDFKTPVTGELTLYPVWKIEFYKVTFICGEDVDNPPLEITLDYGSPIPPQNVTKTGYVLKGWSLSEDGSEPYDLSTPIKSDVTLYPVFEGKEMTVNFIYEDKEPISSRTYNTGDKISLSDLSFKLFEKEYALDDRIYTLKLVDAGTGTQYSLDDPLPYSETGFTFVCNISSNLFTVDKSGAVAGTTALVDIEGPYTLIIPRYLNGVKASTIKDTGFYYSDWDKDYQFDKLILPNTLTSIGVNAFSSCGNLAEVEIPSSVKSINDYSFIYCTKLSKIDIPEGVETIGEGGFASCFALSEINLPSSLTTIGAQAFGDCDALTSFTIPNTVTTIGDEAFSNCNNLEAITLPSNASFTQLSNSLFMGCDKLTDIKIPASFTKIGDNAFYGCKSLRSITIPKSVTTIGENAFSDSGLSSIEIPDSVTSIGASAFFACSALTGITINGAIETIQEHTFESCTNLSSIRVPDSVKTIEECVFLACTSLTSITIGSGIKTIDSNAFFNCTKLTDIYINKDDGSVAVPLGKYTIHWNSTGPTTE